jgi:hypothetical protein
MVYMGCILPVRKGGDQLYRTNLMGNVADVEALRRTVAEGDAMGAS